MINIEITYNGKEYKTLLSAFEQAAIDQIKEMVKDAAKPFYSDISKTGGKVSVEINGGIENAQIVFTDIDQDIIDKITDSIH